MVAMAGVGKVAALEGVVRAMETGCEVVNLEELVVVPLEAMVGRPAGRGRPQIRRRYWFPGVRRLPDRLPWLRLQHISERSH